MKIAYHSYLLETICDDVSLRRVYTEPGSAYRISNSYNFDFDVNVSLSRLREQADTFSDYILSQKGYQTRALQDRNIREDQKRLSGAYIYSYLKVIFYSYAHSRYSIKFTSSSSLVFGGHKVLYDCVRRRNINDYSSQNDAMSSVSIEISRKLIESLCSEKADDPVSVMWRKLVKSPDITYDDDFYDRDCEYTLGALKDMYDFLDIRKLYDDDSETPKTYPLGNSCYDKDLKTVLYLNNKELAADYRSNIWGVACFITIKNEDVIDSDDRYYRSVSSENVKFKRLVGYEVYSITNYLPYARINDGRFSSERPSGGNSNGGGPNPTKGSFGLGGKGGDPTPGNINPPKRNDPPNPSPDSQSMLNKLGDSTKNIINKGLNLVKSASSIENIEKAERLIKIVNDIKDRGYANQLEVEEIESYQSNPLRIEEKSRSGGVNLGGIRYEQEHRTTEYSNR